MAAVTVDGGHDAEGDALRQVAVTTFESWIGRLAEMLAVAASSR